MATHKITVSSRSDAGKGASRRLRRSGKVPGILYGGTLAPLSIELDHEEVILAARNEWFFSSVLDLDMDGETQAVLVRDWQMHPYKQQMLHLDFMRVDENAEIHVFVPLRFINQETSPAGKASGLVISHNMSEVEVACLPKDLPEHIVVDLATLAEGDLIHMSELKLPARVELLALRLGKEHDQTVVSVHEVKEEVDEVPAAAEGEEAAADGKAAGAGAAGAKPGEDKAAGGKSKDDG